MKILDDILSKIFIEILVQSSHGMGAPRHRLPKLRICTVDNIILLRINLLFGVHILCQMNNLTTHFQLHI